MSTGIDDLVLFTQSVQVRVVEVEVVEVLLELLPFKVKVDVDVTSRRSSRFWRSLPCE